jgi:hypothetical protein
VLRIKVRGHKALETLIGHAPSVTVGEYVSAIGECRRKRVRYG